ncbi:MAG: alpha/beta fold hydrolase [Anaerolineae bacterium]|nr:alpha/beta fold hydrolase [Anaerolineae bacterium]
MHIEVITHHPESEIRETPLLFVHGAWHGAWCWEEFQPYFADRGYRTYALSLRGHCGSEGKLRTARIHDYVDDVARIAAQIEEETGQAPVVIGHSMGGFVTQKYLETHDAPAAVLLASIPVTGYLASFTRFTLRYPLRVLRSLVTFDPYAFVSSPQQSRRLFFSEDISEETLAKHFARIQSESLNQLFDILFLNLPRPDRVSAPLLVLGAANDAIFTHREIERTAAAYGTQAEFFPMAHDMMLESGWEAVADRIIEWLEDSNSASPNDRGM